MRQSRGTRGQIDSKSNPRPERAGVYAVGISVKVGVHYPGRSVGRAGSRYGRDRVAPPGNQAANGEDKDRPGSEEEGNPRREARLARQKSAEGIGGETNAKGPNMSVRTGA